MIEVIMYPVIDVQMLSHFDVRSQIFDILEIELAINFYFNMFMKHKYIMKILFKTNLHKPYFNLIAAIPKCHQVLTGWSNIGLFWLKKLQIGYSVHEASSLD
uniref:Uncharacterized protein n=1 Tax=Oryza brachyantha TaxID=4533 RepID=J3LGA2_ORYBR